MNMMDAAQLVDVAQEFERRLGIERIARAQAADERQRARSEAADERRHADDLAAVVRIAMPDSAVLAAFDRYRNPPHYWHVAVPPGGSVKVFDAEGNET